MFAVKKSQGFIYKLNQDKLEINGSTNEINLISNYHIHIKHRSLFV